MSVTPPCPESDLDVLHADGVVDAGVVQLPGEVHAYLRGHHDVHIA